MTPQDRADTRVVLAAVAMLGLYASGRADRIGETCRPGQRMTVVAAIAVEQADALLAALDAPSESPRMDKAAQANESGLRG